MTTPIIRAKMKLNSVNQFEGAESLLFNAVAASSYSQDGSDEDNTYAHFTPSAKCEILVTNPALLGKLKPGKKYYVDFTEAPE